MEKRRAPAGGRRSLEVIVRKLLQSPQRPALVYLHFWGPTRNMGRASFWAHTPQPGARARHLPAQRRGPSQHLDPCARACVRVLGWVRSVLPRDAVSVQAALRGLGITALLRLRPAEHAITLKAVRTAELVTASACVTPRLALHAQRRA